MSLIIPVAFAALMTWLVVRLVNRGWKPGRRFWLMTPVVIVLGYPLSFGPVCWLVGRGLLPDEGSATIYRPLFYLMAEKRREGVHGYLYVYVHPLLKRLLGYGILFDPNPREKTKDDGTRYFATATVAATWARRFARTIEEGQLPRFPRLRYDLLGRPEPVESNR